MINDPFWIVFEFILWYYRDVIFVYIIIFYLSTKVILRNQESQTLLWK